MRKPEQYNCVRGNVELGTVTKRPEDPGRFPWVSPHLANHSQAKFIYLCSRKALAFVESQGVVNGGIHSV